MDKNYRFAGGRKIGDILVLKSIKENQPINPYKLSKKLKISYRHTKRIIKELERRKLIKIEEKPKIYEKIISLSPFCRI